MKAGNQCQLFGYEGATHGFFNPSRDGGTWYRLTLLEMDRFLTKIGYLSGEPQASDNGRGAPRLIANISQATAASGECNGVLCDASLFPLWNRVARRRAAYVRV